MNSGLQIFAAGLLRRLRGLLVKALLRSRLFDNKIVSLAADCDEEETVAVSYGFREEQLPERITRLERVHHLYGQKTSAIANAVLRGPHATGYTERGEIVQETLTPAQYGNYKTLGPGSLLPGGRSRRTLSGSCYSMVNPWCMNYYHWTVDQLLRMEAVLSGPVGNLQLIVPAGMTAWQAESLRLLGLPEESFFRWDGSTVAVEKLLLTGFREKNGIIAPSAAAWLRNALGRHITEKADRDEALLRKRIILSRRNSPGRNLVNEEELVERLAPFGFVPVAPDELSFTDQYRLFSRAEIVIAPHGAGLTNMLYSDNLSVIEIFGNMFDPCYFAMASSLGHRYRFIRGEERKSLHPRRADMYVSPDAVIDTLRIWNAL